MTVALEKFEKMSVQDQKRTFIVYANFMKINNEVKKLTPIVMKDFNTNIEITFHDIDM